MNLSVAQRGVGYQYDNVIYSQAGGDLNFMALTKAIIARESQWNASAVNPADPSYGLMQILLKTARLFSPGVTSSQLLDPITNIVIGTSYLHDLVNTYSDFPSIISSYNAGKPRLDINQSYVNDVLDYYNWYLQNDPVIQGSIVPADVSVPGEVLTPSSTDYGAKTIPVAEVSAFGGITAVILVAGALVLWGVSR